MSTVMPFDIILAMQELAMRGADKIRLIPIITELIDENAALAYIEERRN